MSEKTTQTTPTLSSSDVIEYIKSGRMADKTIPKWFVGTTSDFVLLFGYQNFKKGEEYGKIAF